MFRTSLVVAIPPRPSPSFFSAVTNPFLVVDVGGDMTLRTKVGGTCNYSRGFESPPRPLSAVLRRFGTSRLLLPVSVCCANIAFYGDFFIFRFTFEEGAWTKVPKTVRTFAILLLNNAVVNRPENL